ncbi:hypothetical protein EPA93_08525 [Ktedonosporobacter rubrisoli]|uniref:AAA family ATPase n=1 Tax=Ktedonosporobacter rubrisoli TaxID=2509675 RepID=A0A4P6JLD5_KTERU|nr:hypothetical protein [Ktedonosporobacter rubrisoli]QBD76047.1 hypothetical protein EPA93_08525 [Ktedonosporobacter rubrisoli]
MTRIHILGAPGSGKTTLARQLSEHLHVPHHDLDKLGLEKGRVSEEDAFAIAERPAWISEGVYLIWTEPLLYHAEVIVLLEVSWPVALWRILLRHVTRSLHGTNPYPGLNGVRLLFKLMKDTREYLLNQEPAASPLAQSLHRYLEEQRVRSEPPTLDAVRREARAYPELSFPPTDEFLHRYLSRYRQKVIRVGNKAERERLLTRLTPP